MANPKYEKTGDSITNLIEECAELSEACSKMIHILCKAQRFGLKNWHPDDKKQRTNHELILKEMKDVDKRMGDYCEKYGYPY